MGNTARIAPIDTTAETHGWTGTGNQETRVLCRGRKSGRGLPWVTRRGGWVPLPVSGAERRRSPWRVRPGAGRRWWRRPMDAVFEVGVGTGQLVVVFSSPSEPVRGRQFEF